MGLFDSLFKKKTAPAPVKQACTPQTELYSLPAVQLPDGLQGEALLDNLFLPPYNISCSFLQIERKSFP